MPKLNNIELTIWNKPYHSTGFLKTLWVFEEDGIYTAVLREQHDQMKTNSKQMVVEDRQLFETECNDFNPRQIASMLSAINFNALIEYDYKKRGGTFFGIRIERGYQKSTFEWHGDMNNFEPGIVSLYKYVYNM